MKLNFVYISGMNMRCDLPFEHSFCVFCETELVIIIHKVTIYVLDTLCLILGWDSFFSLHYCVHTCCMAFCCPFDVEGSVARDVVCGA